MSLEIFERMELRRGEKVGVSFQMPKKLKIQVDKICHERQISFTAFMVAIAEYAVETDRLLKSGQED